LSLPPFLDFLRKVFQQLLDGRKPIGMLPVSDMLVIAFATLVVKTDDAFPSRI